MNINDFTPWREGEYPRFSSAEKRCSHIANNPHHKHIRQFKVDGEVFPPGTPQKRCDYLLLDDTGHQSYYIELKGSDVLTAIAQIEDTISEISPTSLSSTFSLLLFNSSNPQYPLITCILSLYPFFEIANSLSINFHLKLISILMNYIL